MRASILYFFFLVLGISLNFGPDVGYKRGRFPKTLLEKGLEFDLSEKGGPVALNLDLMLLLAEVDLVPKKRGRKGSTLGPYSIGRIEMVLVLSTKIVALHMQVSIIQVGVTGLEDSLLGSRVYLAIFLAFDK